MPMKRPKTSDSSTTDKHPERPMARSIDVFANHLKRHGNVQRAARDMGLAPASGNGMLQRLRRELGWQAQ